MANRNRFRTADGLEEIRQEQEADARDFEERQELYEFDLEYGWDLFDDMVERQFRSCSPSAGPTSDEDLPWPSREEENEYLARESNHG